MHAWRHAVFALDTGDRSGAKPVVTKQYVAQC